MNGCLAAPEDKYYAHIPRHFSCLRPTWTVPDDLLSRVALSSGLTHAQMRCTSTRLTPPTHHQHDALCHNDVHMNDA